MYMRVQYNFAKKQTWRDYVDLSNYTGMEVEHGLNTADRYVMSGAATLGHFNPHSPSTNFGEFTKEHTADNKVLREAAMK